MHLERWLNDSPGCHGHHAAKSAEMVRYEMREGGSFEPMIDPVHPKS